MQRKLEFSQENSVSSNSAMTDEDKRLMARIVKNSGKFVVREDLVDSLGKVDDISEVQDLRIVCLSFKMPVPASNAVRGDVKRGGRVSKEPYSVVQYKLKSRALSASEILSTVEEVLIEAKEANKPIHYLVLNELATSYQKPDKLVKDIKNRVAVHGFENTIVVAGTFHCKKECYNVAPVLAGSTRINVVKRNSASKQKEFVRTTDTTHFRRFKTPYGTILIWICLDMYDPSLVFKLIRWNYRLSPERGIHVADHEIDFEPVDLLLVPSYNSDLPDQLEDTMRLVSKYARTTVVMCNDLASWSELSWDSSLCYRFGNSVTPQVSSKLGGKCNVSIFEISGWDKNIEGMSSSYEDFSGSLAHIFGCEASTVN